MTRVTAAARRAGLAAAAACCGLVPAGAAVARIETPAPYAYVVDLSTDTVLLEKQADAPMPPASMSKLMTIYMLFEAIKEGRYGLDDRFLVSRKAWRKGGSKMFVRVGDEVSVADLLRGIIVQSGNDACIVVAEAMSGSEEAFAEAMTARARELGLTRSTFANATGWPHPDHAMSARDLAKLSRILIEKFPEMYKMFREKSFIYNKIKQGNRNPLLYRSTGADGLKTGYTEEAGYGLAASAARGERRVVLVVNGLKSVRQRSREALRLLNWAFSNFRPYKLFRRGEKVVEADVWLGRRKTVALTVPDDVEISLDRKARTGLEAKVRLTEPVAAPVRKGDLLGTLIVSAPGAERREIRLEAGADVEKSGLLARIAAAVGYVLWGS